MLLIKVEKKKFCLHILHWATEFEKYIILTLFYNQNYVNLSNLKFHPQCHTKSSFFLKITHIKNQMDFNKHDLAIFLCDMWQKYSKCKVTSTKAKSTFPRQLLLPNGPVAWSLVYSIHAKKWNITHNPLQMDWQMSQILQNLPNDVFYPLDKFLWSH